MDALVLAGGMGTRLRARFADLPKPMAPVAGRPFLEHVLDPLHGLGISRVVLSVGHLAEVVERHFGTAYGPLELVYSRESTPLGTGGAIRHALPFLTAPFLVLNGDTYVPVDALALTRAVVRADDGLGLTVVGVDDVARFGGVVIRDDRVTGLGEKSATGPGLINAGAYVLGGAVADRLAAMGHAFSFEREVLEPWIAERGAAYVRSPGPFIDIGIPEDYDRAGTVLIGGPT